MRNWNLKAYCLLTVLFAVSATAKNPEDRTFNHKTVKWLCSTKTNLWTDKGYLNVTSWDNDTLSYISVDSSTKYQKIEGWGGCFNEKGWEAMSILSTTERTKILKALFDSKTGLKLNICRTPIGASDYALTNYSLNETPNDFLMKNFSIDRDKQMLIPYIKAAMRFRPDLKLWGIPWTPPSWMKDNNKLANGGNFISSRENMEALAIYFEKYIKAYRALGLNIYMIMPQNEPTQWSEFVSCVWKAEQLRDFIKNHLVPTLKKDNVKCDIFLGSLTDPDYNYVTTSMNDSVASKYIAGVGCQWRAAPSALKSHFDYPNLKLMQTETECGVKELEGDSWQYAELQFGIIKKYMEAWVNSYMLWNLVLDETEKNSTGWPQYSPIEVNKITKKVLFYPQYYVFKHFSSFVKPGAFRIKNIGNYNDKIAFENPNGNIVIVIQNSSEKIKQLAININGLKIKPSLPPHFWSTFTIR